MTRPTTAKTTCSPPTIPFDPGYGQEPFCKLCAEIPGPDVYPPEDFLVEWGPVFHRGRLDGSARVLVLGMAPGPMEVVARRILLGDSGQRVQGFLAKLGITRSYVMLNTFLYAAAGHRALVRHQDNPAVTAYRNRWLDALVLGTKIKAVITLGARADGAWQSWKETATGQRTHLLHVKLTHPTQPESAHPTNPVRRAEATALLLRGWNEALETLQLALRHGDIDTEPSCYGETFRPKDLTPIPNGDLAAGTPSWMGSSPEWAQRAPIQKDRRRGSIVICTPSDGDGPSPAADSPNPIPIRSLRKKP